MILPNLLKDFSRQPSLQLCLRHAQQMFGGMIASNDKALRVRDNDSRIQRLQDRRDVRAHVLGLTEVLAKAGIGLGQFEIHLLKPGRQRIIRLLKDRRSLVKVLKGAREEIIVRLVRALQGHAHRPPCCGANSGWPACMTAAMRRTRPSVFPLSERNSPCAKS